MAKTALQELKHSLETVYNESYKLRQSDYEQGRADMLDLVIQWVENAIPQERQQIEEAWNEGFDEIEYTSKTGVDYYESKYTKK